MSNLIPEVRANKNGVLVTKHVRADSNLGRRKSDMFPVPSASNAEQQKESVVSKLTALLEERDNNISIPNQTLSMLSECPPEILDKAFQLVHDWPKEKADKLHKIFGVISSNTGMFYSIINVGLEVDEMMVDGFDATEEIISICNTLKISEMDTVPNEFHYSLIKAEVLARIVYISSPSRALLPHERALVLEQIRVNIDVLQPSAPVLKALAEIGGDEAFDYDFGTIDMMMKAADVVQRNPGKAEEIATIIRERRMFNYSNEIIEDILESSAPAISSGVL